MHADRLAVLTWTLPSWYGRGGQTASAEAKPSSAYSNRALDLALALRSEGMYVDLVVQWATQEQIDALPSGVGCEVLDRHAYFAVPRLRSYLYRQQPTTLLSIGSYLGPAAVLAKMTCRWNGLLVLNEGSMVTNAAGLDNMGKLRHRYLPRLVRALYPYADAVVGCSEAVRRDLQTAVLSGSRTVVRTIRNWVDDDRVRRLAVEPVDPPFERGEVGSAPLFLNVGRLYPQKDQELLVRAFARFRATHGCGTLLIIGGGPLRADLEALVARLGLGECVRLLGEVANPYPYFRLADAFVLSSRHEGLPLVLVEAMILGCPIIATDSAGGVGELLADGRAGLLVPVGDEVAFTKGMEALASDATMRESLISKGIEQAKRFEPKAVVGQWLALIEELGASRPPRCAPDRDRSRHKPFRRQAN